jgi:hypothetical protein
MGIRDEKLQDWILKKESGKEISTTNRQPNYARVSAARVAVAASQQPTASATSE